MSLYKRLKEFSAALGRWRKKLDHKQDLGNQGDEIIHPAAASMEADQETSGHVTTPDGRHRHIETDGSQTIKSGN